jgi:hypothetical protein
MKVRTYDKTRTPLEKYNMALEKLIKLLNKVEMIKKPTIGLLIANFKPFFFTIP